MNRIEPRASDPDRHAREKQLFAGGRPLRGEERRAFLASLRREDPELAARVERLLEADRELDAALDPPCAAGGEVFAKLEQIGEYRILRCLGEGGMGVVYEAEQRQPRRRVALKVIRPGFMTPTALQRFEHEALVLGRLQHPSIAQVHEAGTADTPLGSLPFFAMELVDGEPLHHFLQAHRRSLRARLELFLQVCAAVQHAHQKGVIHRDLKPGNILVHPEDRVKVLDFGIARVTDGDVRGPTFTREGELIGTLAYMSPEQAAGDSRDLDTRSDVYALGVLLYEMISGELPFDLSGLGIPRAVRVLLEQEPVPLGERDRAWRGDLQTIVHHALEKDRERRYASAHDLAADVQRFLCDEPITARPASALYQLRKFTRRNRILVGGVAGVILALAAGLVTSLLFYSDMRDQRTAALVAQGKALEEKAAADRARHAEADQRRAAEHTAGVLRETQSFFDSIFERPSPLVDGHDVRVVDAMERAHEQMEGAFQDRPDLRAWLLHRLGKTYRGLGLTERSETYLREALALLEAEKEPPVLEVAAVKCELSRVLGELQRYGETEELLQEAHEALMETGSRGTWQEVELEVDFAALYTSLGRTSEGEEHARAALRLAESLPGGAPGALAETYQPLAQSLALQGRSGEAEEVCRAALQIFDRELGQHSYRSIPLRRILASALMEQGRAAEAEPLVQASLEDLVRVTGVGDTSPALLPYLEQLAQVQLRLGKEEEALARLERAREILRRSSGVPRGDAAGILLGLGVVYQQRGDAAAAEPYLREAVSGYEEVLEPTSTILSTAYYCLATALLDLGDFEEARFLLEDSRDILRPLGDPPSLHLAWDLIYLARLDQKDGDLDAARAGFEEGAEIYRLHFGEEHPEVLNCRAGAAACLLEAGHVEEARKLLDELWVEAPSRLDPPGLASLQAIHGFALWQTDEPAEGERLLREACRRLAGGNEHDLRRLRAERYLAEVEGGGSR